MSRRPCGRSTEEDRTKLNTESGSVRASASLDSFRVTTLYNFTNPTAKPGLNSGMISTVTDKNIGGTGSVLNIDFLVRAIDGQTIMTASANVENDFGSSGRRHACAQWEHDQWSRVAAQLQRG